jgi:hypothetical protein
MVHGEVFTVRLFHSLHLTGLSRRFFGYYSHPVLNGGLRQWFSRWYLGMEEGSEPVLLDEAT